MAAEISYRHEYLTGFAMAAGSSPMLVGVGAQNHGPFEERMRILGLSLRRKVCFDSGDVVVEAHHGWGAYFDMLDAGEGGYGSPACYRVQILTSSTNLILSVGDPNGMGVQNDPPREPIVPFPYYGPKDFVAFTLAIHPPVSSPVGALESP